MTEPHFESIRVERADGIVTVTLDRPSKKNAADMAMWRELTETFRDVAKRVDDRVLVLTGAGGEFCSGADLGDPAALSVSSLVRMRLINDTCLALHRLPQPTIARVQGVAAGAGCNMALACDLVVAADTSRFSQIFARRGLSLDFGGSWLLPRLIGLHKAKELALFGDILSADEVAALGLVNRVVAADRLDDVVGEWARRLASGPTQALSLSKRMLNDAFSRTLEEALDDEARAQAINFESADTREAITAFIERRDPVFTGR